MTLNPKIQKTVARLQDAGFDTVDSGDGETHDFECDRSHPYVSIVVSPSEMVDEAKRLVALVESWGVSVEPIGFEDTCCVEASYDPANGIAILDLRHINDDDLPDDPSA